MVANGKKVDLMIRNASVLTPEMNVKVNQCVVIDHSNILEIGDDELISLSYEARETLNAEGKLVMPGMIDAHMHTCQQLIRGRITDEYPMIWTRIMVPYESNLREEDVKTSAELSFLEMIKSGTTGFIDAGGTYMHKVAQSAIQSGIRGAITCSTMDSGEGIPESMKKSTEENIRINKELYQNFHGAGDGRLDVWFSLRSIISCSPSLIQSTFEVANELGTGVQTHMNEYPNEVRYCLEKYQKRPFEFLASLNILDVNFLAAHGILLSENEMDIIKDHDIKIAHCPTSNSGKGFTKTPSLLHKGVGVALGTDGAGHTGLNLFDQMKVLKSLMRAFWGVSIFDPKILPSAKILEMATLGGAKALMRDDILGTLEVGKKADMILVNIDQPHIEPTHNLIHTLIDSCNHQDVKDVIVDGKIVMKNREVLTMDEERIKYESKKQMKEIAVRASL
ncbi:amidohydrolase family protein [Lentibacillus salinarum]|uniref:Amidohydrolase family protein n=1 Tax=Lentibacillus salinarum TaxID=446820 RepID=A0ABW3ZNW4_9BACI